MKNPTGRLFALATATAASQSSLASDASTEHSRFGGDFHLRRVVATGMEWVTAGDALETTPAAANGAILFHRLDKIGAARGLKAAIAADQRAECPLVSADGRDEQRARQLPNLDR